MRILRVFPIKTTMTPDDEYVRIGEPDLLPLPEIDEVHISCIFTWHTERARLLAGAWASRLPGMTIRLGGPAFGDVGGEFVPGRYLRKGLTITSRGCPNRCPWCYVPKREGALRLLPIRDGNEIQDNNILACPEDHFAAVCDMLARQRKGARFVGGFESNLLREWHIKHMSPLSINEIWLACDTMAAIQSVRGAVEMLAELPSVRAVKNPRNKLRCYVLIGRGTKTLAEDEERLEAVWRAGCLPFAQLFRDDAGAVQATQPWRDLARKWSRPAIMVADHKKIGNEL